MVNSMGSVESVIDEDPAEQAKPAARPAGVKPGAAGPGARKPSAQHMHRYYEVLGLKSGATLDAINTAYYMLIKRLPENPTEEDEARLQEIKRAYEMLKRTRVAPKRKVVKVLLSRRLLIPVMSALTVASLAGLVAVNWGAIKLSMTHYEPGAVLRFKSQGQPYGEVTGFDARHKWDTGNPSPAYSIRLQGTQDVVWVGERLVVNGMIPVK
jgi:hypothetical protein